MSIEPISPSDVEASPRAPSLEVWTSMSAADREAVLATLVPIPDHEALPSEGDWHIDAVRVNEDALGGYFKKRQLGAYIGRGLTVYYPEEIRFAPDLFVVLEAEKKKRNVWVVNAEGRGLDFVLEVHYGGRKRKDAETNVARYARLGIPEYFMFDARRTILHGWHLLNPTDRTYTRIVPQNGRWVVRTLGMELGLRDGLPRWYDGVGIIPLVQELNAELAQSLNDALERTRQAEAERDEAEARAAAETERAVAEAERASRAEAEVSRLLSEIERLKKT